MWITEPNPDGLKQALATLDLEYQQVKGVYGITRNVVSDYINESRDNFSKGTLETFRQIMQDAEDKRERDPAAESRDRLVADITAGLRDLDVEQLASLRFDVKRQQTLSLVRRYGRELGVVEAQYDDAPPPLSADFGNVNRPTLDIKAASDGKTLGRGGRDRDGDDAN